jgi:hypothetical protein
MLYPDAYPDEGAMECAMSDLPRRLVHDYGEGTTAIVAPRPAALRQVDVRPLFVPLPHLQLLYFQLISMSTMTRMVGVSADEEYEDGDFNDQNNDDEYCDEDTSRTSEAWIPCLAVSCIS